MADPSGIIPEDVPDDCMLYRMVRVRDIQSDGVPMSSCFSDSPRDSPDPEDYMSLYAHDELVAAGWTVQKLSESWGPAYRVYALTAERLRSCGERVWRAPMGDIPGHCGCKRNNNGRRTGGQKRTLARVVRYVDLSYEQS